MTFVLKCKYIQDMLSKHRWKLDVHVVIVFLQNAKLVIHRMTVLIVLGRNAIVGQKIIKIRSVLKLTFENIS